MKLFHNSELNPNEYFTSCIISIFDILWQASSGEKQAFVIHGDEMRFPRDRLMNNYLERFGLCFGGGKSCGTIIWKYHLRYPGVRVGSFAYRTSSLASYHHANGEWGLWALWALKKRSLNDEFKTLYLLLNMGWNLFITIPEQSYTAFFL